MTPLERKKRKALIKEIARNPNNTVLRELLDGGIQPPSSGSPVPWETQPAPPLLAPVGGGVNGTALTAECSNKLHAANWRRDLNDRSLLVLPSLLPFLMPGGQIRGEEYEVRNPRRNDLNPGSFKINVVTGRWIDFAASDDAKGPDLISYIQYCKNTESADKAAELIQMALERSDLSQVAATLQTKRDWTPIAPIPQQVEELTAEDAAKFSQPGTSRRQPIATKTPMPKGFSMSLASNLTVRKNRIEKTIVPSLMLGITLRANVTGGA